jgi:hypothetical protein
MEYPRNDGRGVLGEGAVKGVVVQPDERADSGEGDQSEPDEDGVGRLEKLDRFPDHTRGRVIPLHATPESLRVDVIDPR